MLNALLGYTDTKMLQATLCARAILPTACLSRPRCSQTLCLENLWQFAQLLPCFTTATSTGRCACPSASLTTSLPTFPPFITEILRPGSARLSAPTPPTLPTTTPICAHSGARWALLGTTLRRSVSPPASWDTPIIALELAWQCVLQPPIPSASTIPLRAADSASPSVR
jgi:hypothetical protein